MKTQIKIAIVICYYGKFPWYFDLFLHSASFNPSIDIFIITDLDKPYYCPPNVFFVKMSIDDVRNLATHKLQFEVCIDNYYKFCDFKPAYGYIFSDIIQQYDFWGIGDIDVIYGNIRAFITEELLTTYDLISVRPEYISGFFTLFRNCKKINELFMESRDYQKVFSDSKHYCFDECSHLHFLLWDNKMSVYDINWEIQSMTYIAKKAHDEERIMALFEFFVVEGMPGRLKWNNGELFYANKLEVLLYHLIEYKRKGKVPQISFHEIQDCYQIKKNEMVFTRNTRSKSVE